MAEAFVTVVLQQLASIIDREIEQEVRQVVGVEKEVDKLSSTLLSIEATLDDAEMRQIKEKAVKVWLEKLKLITYGIDDVLDEWSTAIIKQQIESLEKPPTPKTKVCSYIASPCFSFSRVVLRHDIALKIKELNERLDLIANEKERYNFRSIRKSEEPDRQKTTSFIDVLEVYGRDQDKKTIVNKLLCQSSQEERDLYVISIVGMGGVGKTTLSQLAYNDDDVKAHFEKRIWVCVSSPFDEIRIARTIAKALDASEASSLDWENLPQHIHESIVGMRFLLVLDDVWIEDYKKWEILEQCLKGSAQGSRILVTTRNERVAKMMGTTYTHPLEELSKEVCRSLFSRIAFYERSAEDVVKLEETGRKIADKCKGLPLAVKTLGSLMRFKRSEQDWRNVLNSEFWELEEAEKGLFPPLLLSYYDLPSVLKRCFLYCAIFPKDYEIKTNKLIKLWMAQGYLSSRQCSDMETTGQNYFENLAMRSLFQDFEKDEDGSIRSCKMHDIVHDFAHILTKNECFVIEVDGEKVLSIDSSYRKGRHLSITLAADAPFPISIYKRESLHTLIVMRKVTKRITTAVPDLFHHLKCLRALDLSENSIEELPREVGNLMHLRYLDLSGGKMKELPETICELCNLQTLDITLCWRLKELPKGIGKLIKLRHLEMPSQLEFMPKGIGRLKCLQTLTKFVVGGADEREACKVGHMKDLNNLHGHLRMEGLGKVASVGEAEKAELKHKEHLLGLNLDFSPERTTGDMNDVIEALQPHPNLEVLTIWLYRGTLFPKWIMSLTKLRHLKLLFCRNCAILPPLGKLPSLESLQITVIDSLEKLGVEWLGVEINDNYGTRSNDSGLTEASSVLIAFPKLKQLRFDQMKAWEEWDVMITRRRNEEIKIMPCLQSLKISDCPKLKELPHYLQTMPLEELEIRRCPILKQRCQKEVGGDWIKISHIPNINIFN